MLRVTRAQTVGRRRSPQTTDIYLHGEYSHPLALSIPLRSLHLHAAGPTSGPCSQAAQGEAEKSRIQGGKQQMFSLHTTAAIWKTIPQVHLVMLLLICEFSSRAPWVSSTKGQQADLQHASLAPSQIKSVYFGYPHCCDWYLFHPALKTEIQIL